MSISNNVMIVVRASIDRTSSVVVCINFSRSSFAPSKSRMATEKRFSVSKGRPRVGCSGRRGRGGSVVRQSPDCGWIVELYLSRVLLYGWLPPARGVRLTGLVALVTASSTEIVHRSLLKQNGITENASPNHTPFTPDVFWHFSPCSVANKRRWGQECLWGNFIACLTISSINS